MDIKGTCKECGCVTGTVGRFIFICRECSRKNSKKYKKRIEELKALGGNPDIEKLCTRCKVIKPLDEFFNLTGHPTEKRSACKRCEYDYQNKWYDNNIEHCAAKRKEFNDKNHEAIKKYKREHKRKAYHENPEKGREQSRIYREKHPDKVKAGFKKWAKLNRDKINEGNNRRNKLIHNNINGRMSRAVRVSLKNNNLSKDGESWRKLIGYSSDELKLHIESKFTDGMSWERLDEIEIDHIFCKASLPFNSVKDESFKILWSIENLYPLWTTDNIKKSDKHPRDFYGDNYQEILGLSDEFVKKVHKIYDRQTQLKCDEMSFRMII